ncbi:glycerol-3-phosphate dehydrogenase/oxidase [Neobacillus sp. OS1-33]|uniref:glycerol-3-phosphate dehydrogenase/oxidase n=1 Tax=Neobacillus sp. OS1-33 TaxID=3070683 RepID=UPI0027E2053A|nr:glycerol-3-phosphate dehydrogenase/oxidase [Neobacillus sp. OS1-33]WML28463.1 glycerol-3-phosphate dehydrogenase/oxidase [Neobacillus sp. OS1-33]
MLKFSSSNRNTILKEMAAEEFDVLVIGGGITGAGIALDAVTRGMKTALVEMQDYAAGTSSRSTKLVHGGLRYLKQFEVKMVAEVGKERAIVYENGPHVTTPEWMLLPIHTGGTFGKISTSIGLRIYDFLADVKKGERRRMLSSDATIQKEPLIKSEGLKGGGYYVEYRTDDARLTIEVIKEAVTQGVRAVNYTKVIDLLYRDEIVIGAIVENQLDGSVHTIYANKVINATGPWVDSLRDKDHSLSGKKLRLTKGVHLVIDQSRFPLKQAVYFDTPDRRMVFAIPRDGKTYVGTTDTYYGNDPIHPKMTADDRDYIMNAIHYMFPTVDIKSEDIESSWAGVRPLIYEEGKDPSEISRKDEIWVSKSGLVTIAGGKLTGYRKMAETVIDLIALQSKDTSKYKACQTKHLPISGGHFDGSHNFVSFIEAKENDAELLGFSKDQYRKLVHRYGSNIDRIFGIAKTYEPNNKYGLPQEIYVQIVYSLEEEMIVKPVDFFIRRTGALFFDIKWVYEWKEAIIGFMNDALEWTNEEKVIYREELETILNDAIHPDPNEMI